MRLTTPKANMSQVSILWLLDQWIFWKGGKKQQTGRESWGEVKRETWETPEEFGDDLSK